MCINRLCMWRLGFNIDFINIVRYPFRNLSNSLLHLFFLHFLIIFTSHMASESRKHQLLMFLLLPLSPLVKVLPSTHWSILVRCPLFKHPQSVTTYLQMLSLVTCLFRRTSTSTPTSGTSSRTQTTTSGSSTLIQSYISTSCASSLTTSHELLLNGDINLTFDH